MGFLGPEHVITDDLDLKYDARSNYQADYGRFQSSERRRIRRWGLPTRPITRGLGHQRRSGVRLTPLIRIS